MKKFLALVLSIVMVLSLVACGGGETTPTPDDTQDPVETTEPVDVVLATGGTSGTYYAVGGVLQTVLGDKLTLANLTVESTGASKANVNMMTDGEAQMAILQSDVLNYAHEGTFTFADTGAETSALWVMGIYNETVQILAKPGINTVSDLKGKTICVGDVGSGTEVNAWQVLGAVGLTKDDVNAVNGSFQDGVDQLKDGKIDAMIATNPINSASLKELVTSANAKMIPVENDAFYEKIPAYTKYTLPAGTYEGINYDVTIPKARIIMITTEEAFTEDEAYLVTKTIWENRSEWSSSAKAVERDVVLETALEEIDIPLHKGAIRYFDEIGMTVPANLR